jgi:hypothetical protein
MITPADELVPDAIPALFEATRDAGGAGRSLVLAGSTMTFSGKRKVGVFAVDGEAPEPLVVGFVLTEEFEPLTAVLQAVSETLRGGWDAMYATGWSWLWWRDETRFTVWRKGTGSIATVTGSTLVVGEHSYPSEAIEHVEVWTSTDMVRREVRVTRVDEEPVVIATETDCAPLLDPTYDFLELDVDTAWMQQLGRDLAAALAKPCFDRMMAPDVIAVQEVT